MKDYLNTTKITEAQNMKVKSDIVYTEIIKDFSHLLECTTKIKQEADEQGDTRTSTFVDEFIADYTKTLWMLKQANV